jgi:hypothetical protein
MSIIPKPEEVNKMAQETIEDAIGHISDKIQQAVNTTQTRVKGSVTVNFDFTIGAESK